MYNTITPKKVFDNLMRKGLNMSNLNDLKALKELDTSKVAFSLYNELRPYTSNCMFAAYSIAYAIVKASEIETSDLSSLDSFVKTCNIKEDIALFMSDTLTGFWDIVTRVKGMYDPEMFKSFLLFCDDSDFPADVCSTPNCISHLAIKLLDIKDTDKVADFCTGRASFIRESFLTAPNATYFGNDINLYLKNVAAMRAELLGDNITIVNQNVIAIDFENHSFDKIFANYPFGARIPYGENSTSLRYINRHLSARKKNTSLDWLANISIVNTLNENGKAFALTTAGTLFRGDERDLRKHFVDNGYLNTIIALPAGMFEYTRIPTVAIIISHHNENIRFVDARQICTKGRRFNTLSSSDIDTIVELCSKDSEHSRLVAKDEIIQNDYNLNISNYFEKAIDITNGVAFETVIKKITRGAQLKAAQLDELASDTPTDYQYLMLSDIQNGQIRDSLSYITSIEDSLKKYCIKNNSLILSKSGSPIKAAIATVAEGTSVLATGNLYVVELDENKINPYFLKTFLDSDIGKTALKSISVGSVIPNIPIEALKNMIIPLPAMDVQIDIANEYLSVISEIQSLRSQLAKTENRLKTIYTDNE